MTYTVRPGRDTLLVAGVPPSRGTPVHIEEENPLIAFTEFNHAGKVKEIHTPPDAIIRIHELLHARHTNRRRYDRVYKGVPYQAAQILEDVRIHSVGWPWKRGETPGSVKRAAHDYRKTEMRSWDEALDKRPDFRGKWPDFAVRLRMATIFGKATGHYVNDAIDEADFIDGAQRTLAKQVYRLLTKKKERDAAALIKTAFFPDPPDLPLFSFGGKAGKGFASKPRKEARVITIGGVPQPSMEIIELPHTEHVDGATIGKRRATSGSTLYRPALRRPLLPQRLFIRKTPRDPGGTVLIDASGSMGSFTEITHWLERAPFGTVAYYAGDGRATGWLWVYARNGRRAADIEEPESRGNTVDGPAMTWLLQQPKPRIIVTDRGFCDVTDSDAQVVRLQQLEAAGEVTVANYNTDTEEPRHLAGPER